VDAGLTIAIVDSEVEALGVSLEASNGRFCGYVGAIYGGLDDVASLASGLAGFPATAEDARVFELGTRDLGGVAGWARLGFRVADPAGHGVLDVQLVTTGWTGSTPGPVPETASFSMAVEAASVDRFVAQLRAISSVRSGVARLESHS